MMGGGGDPVGRDSIKYLTAAQAKNLRVYGSKINRGHRNTDPTVCINHIQQL